MGEKKKPTIARSLGLFVGHIVRGAAGDSPDAQTREVRREKEEEEIETPRGKVTLRRTIIEEVDLPQDDC